MEYLKKFENHIDYVNFKKSENFATPNVSWCENDNIMHYSKKLNPFVIKFVSSVSNEHNIYIDDPSGLTDGILTSQFLIDNGITSDVVGDIFIGDFVTSISNNAFENYNGIKNVVIGETVVSISDYAFKSCLQLFSVKIKGSATVGEHVFEGCYVLNNVEMEDVVSIGGQTFKGCFGLKNFNCPIAITKINESTFYNCISLTSIEIPSGVTAIHQSAFYGCSSLTSVTIPSTVTSLYSTAFYGCSSLTSVTIPSSVTSIGTDTFNYCSGLTSITVEAGNTKYDSRDNCNAIIQKSNNALVVGCKNTVIPSSVGSIGNYAFRGCSSLTSITIPSNVTSIGDNSFDNCRGLTSVTIPSSVTYLGSDAFQYCSSLTSVEIPSSVTTLRAYTFAYSGLTSVTIPSTVTTFSNYVFRECKSLTTLNFNATNCTSFPTNNIPFYQTTSLSEINIGSNVTRLPSYLANNSPSKTITCYATTPPTFGTNSFNNTYVTKIYVPSESVETYKATTGWSTFSAKIEAIPSEP